MPNRAFENTVAVKKKLVTGALLHMATQGNGNAVAAAVAVDLLEKLTELTDAKTACVCRTLADGGKMP